MNFIFQFLFNNPTCETEHPHSSRLLSCCIHGPLRLCSGSMNLMIHMFNDRNCIRNNNLSHPWPSPFMFRLSSKNLMILKRPYSTIEIVFVIIICWSQEFPGVCAWFLPNSISFTTNSKLPKFTTPVSASSRRDSSIFKIWTFNGDNM